MLDAKPTKTDSDFSWAGEYDLEFYKTKTYKRVKQYFNRFSYVDSSEIINGIKTPKLHELLDKIDWDNLSIGDAVRYHGDFHFENILVAENGDFIIAESGAFPTFMIVE